MRRDVQTRSCPTCLTGVEVDRAMALPSARRLDRRVELGSLWPQASDPRRSSHSWAVYEKRQQLDGMHERRWHTYILVARMHVAAGLLEYIERRQSVRRIQIVSEERYGSTVRVADLKPVGDEDGR